MGIMRNKPANVVTATYAAKNFGALVDRVREEHAVYEIESHGKVVAHVTPAQPKFMTLADLVGYLRSRPPMAPEVLDEIERASLEMRALPARISEVEKDAATRRRKPPLSKSSGTKARRPRERR